MMIMNRLQLTLALLKPDVTINEIAKAVKCSYKYFFSNSLKI
jgi:hypothetical protein